MIRVEETAVHGLFRRRFLTLVAIAAAGICGVLRAGAAPGVNFLSISNDTRSEGTSGTVVAEFTVTLTPTSAVETITVNYETQNLTAKAPGDYTSKSGSVSFPPGTATQQVTVTVTTDDFAEPNETFRVRLSGATAASISDDEGIGTLTNDDGPVPALSVGDLNVDESATNAVFNVNLSPTVSQTVTVDFQTANGTATGVSDYGVTTGRVTFTANDASEQVTVPIVNDTLDEVDETFFLNLDPATADNATILDAQGRTTIIDNDPTPTLQIGDVVLVEGNSGVTDAVFGVTLSAASGQTVSVDFTTANNTATQPSDYNSTTGTISLPTGTTTQTVNVTVKGDTTYENNETFFMNLTGATNATISDGQGQATISNDDAAPTIAIGDVVLNEGNTGTTNASFTVTKTGTTAITANVNFATANGTAVQPSDYTQTSGSISLASGDVTKTVTVAVRGDTTFEGSENFTMNLSGATDATLSDDGIGAATINNDDTAPTLAVGDVSRSEGDSGSTSFAFVVTKTGATEVTATVDFTTADNTAIAPGDYLTVTGTLTFAPAVSTQTVTVAAIGDVSFEGNEKFFVNLSVPTDATLSDAGGEGVIIDDDPAPTLSIGDVVLEEGNAGTSSAVFTVTKTGTTATSTTVDFTTANGSAVAPSDYADMTGSLTFVPTATTQTISISVVVDTTYENTEAFSVNLINVTNATIVDGQGQATINNDDPKPTLVIGDIVLVEGNSGTSNAVFTVTKTGSSDLTAAVNFSTANGSAVAPGDYTTSTGTVTFDPATITRLVTVTVSGDTRFETDETFFVDLSGPTEALIGDERGQATITNNDSAPTLAIGDVVLAEGNSGTTNATLPVTKTGSTDVTVTVNFATSDVTATAGTDYSPTLGILTILPEATLATVTVSVYGDTVYEGNEEFAVTLSAPQAATLSDNIGRATISNEDNAPVIAIDDVVLAEGNSGTTLFDFFVTKSGPTELPLRVSYDTVGDTATEDVDFVGTAGTLVIPAASTSEMIRVSVNGDVFAEPTEFFFVNIANPVDATISDNQGLGSIQNDDGTSPTISVDDPVVSEGNSGTTDLVFTLSLNVASLQETSVTATTADGTATSPSDFTATSTLVTFPVGITTRPLTVTVIGDVAFENDETMFLNLTNPVNATISDGQGQGAITNDDALPSLSVGDVTMSEGNSGSTNAVFIVTRTASFSITSTVNFATSDGTATQPTDYVSNSGTLTFGPATSTQTATVAVIGDTLFEGNETFVVNLTGPTNATISDGQGQGTIRDDDAPTLTIGDVVLVEGNSGTTNAVFTVTKTGSTEVTATVSFATADNTAAQSSDYTTTTGSLTFAPSTTTQTVSAAVNGDTTFENAETFFVNLTTPNNASIADSQGQGTITNDDAAPSLSINDVIVTEGNSGTTNAVFTVTKTGSTEVTATVSFVTANGTAFAPFDYTAKSGSLTFAPASNTQTVVVLVNGETTFEQDETFFVDLTNPSNVSIADGRGQARILNDDSPTPGPSAALPGLWRSGNWFLRNSHTSGPADISFYYGNPDDVPLMGDWDGDGTRTPGVFRNGNWFLRNSNTGGNADIAFYYGAPGDIPFVGDWDGDGDDTAGVLRSGNWFLRNTNTGGNADIAFYYGNQSGDIPVVGDWDGDGDDTAGIFRGANWFLRNTNTGGGAEIAFYYGNPADKPLAGDWDDDGDFGPGVFRSASWFLKNANSGGGGDVGFSFGNAGDIPLVWGHP